MGKHRYPDVSEGQSLAGVVRQQNFSPRGDIEGVVIDTDAGPAQVNFPHGPGSAMVGPMAVGAEVRFIVSHGEHEHGDHPVHEFIAVADKDGLRAKEPATEPGAEGVVAWLNYARHGEPNGVVLDTGDFIHLKPHGMHRVPLTVGDRVVAVGPAKPTVTGHRVIEAEIVNDVSISHGPHH